MSVMGILILGMIKIRVSLFVHSTINQLLFAVTTSIAETTERRKIYDNSSAPN
jgi:hypothetical protein